MPVVFVSHGAPSLALDFERGRPLGQLGQSLPRPQAILVISAHWQRTPFGLGTTRLRALLHDFSGFDPALERVSYPAPPAPALAETVRELIGAELYPERPWDHGVWVPLLHMYPAADIPVLQLSLASQLAPAELVAAGRRLAPLRQQGVLILASGGLVHNLGQLDWTERSGPAGWALEFEAWLCARLEAFDLESLCDYRRVAPAAGLAHPSAEHLLPLMIALGAAAAGPRRRLPDSSTATSAAVRSGSADLLGPVEDGAQRRSDHWPRARGPCWTPRGTGLGQRKCSVGLEPVLAESALHDQGHTQRQGLLHAACDGATGRLDLSQRYLEQQFIVHLQQHLRR
jgi:4,5-DOPA dioxygenase extradiol